MLSSRYTARNFDTLLYRGPRHSLQPTKGASMTTVSGITAQQALDDPEAPMRVKIWAQSLLDFPDHRVYVVSREQGWRDPLGTSSEIDFAWDSNEGWSISGPECDVAFSADDDDLEITLSRW